MNNNQPIGIFDSGVGGLSVLQHIHRLLPHENLIYIADSGHAPYGCKDQVFVEQRSRIIAEHLISQGVKAIVIACNTATAAIIEAFRKQYDIPFIGVEPGIKPAIAMTKNGRIGIMATAHTLASTRYSELSQRFSEGVHLYHQACPGLADQVEKGQLNNPLTLQLLQEYLDNLQQNKVDTIVLGCTHYSFLSSQIKYLIGDSIILVDTSSAIAEQLLRVITQECLHNINNGSIRYFSSGSVLEMKATIQYLLEYNVEVAPLLED